MPPRPTIIDCDPGQDDAVMLFLAFAAEDKLDILGITTVAGNVPVEKTQRNARMLCDIANKKSLPVYAGCASPIIREPIFAHEIHGEEGLDGVDVFVPETPLKEQHAVDFIIQTLTAAHNNSITLVVTGPMTNIAMAIRTQPNILPKIAEIVIMGGALTEGGNVTPSAEFNIFVDPHAAKVVLDCGRPIVLIGLDVTHKVFTDPAFLERIADTDNKVAATTHDLLSFYARFDAEKYGKDGGPLHDPCTVGYLIQPDLFKLKPCHVDVETASPLTIGHTSVDFWKATDNPPNVNWAYDVDRDGFLDLIIARLSGF